MRSIAALALPVLAVLAGCPVADAAPTAFSVTSSAFADNTPIPVQYSCDGDNVPPPLHWQHLPAGAKSLAIIVDDPDAPGGLYVHWVVTGIAPSITGIAGASLPKAAVASWNSARRVGYLGPCPPPGTGVHHYRFQVYALNKTVTLASSTPASESTATITGATIAVARTTGLFGR